MKQPPLTEAGAVFVFRAGMPRVSGPEDLQTPGDDLVGDVVVVLHITVDHAVGREFDDAVGDRLDELVELMVDTVCSHREMIRIAGDDYPAEVVKSRFLKLNSSHIEYVLERMRENTTYVRNIKKYLLAALYNAPVTMDSYYTSLVSHDLYGSGDRR